MSKYGTTMKNTPRLTLFGLAACAFACNSDAPQDDESASGSASISVTATATATASDTDGGTESDSTTLDSESASGSTSGTTQDDSDSATTSGSTTTTDPGTTTGSATDDGSSSSGLQECAGVSAEPDLTPLPADIIFVVDNSGSMTFEAGEIQDKLNEFSNIIDMAEIDARVVLVSSYPNNGNGICIDPPLGAMNGCLNNANADSDPPDFTHVDDRVASHDAWDVLVDTYDQWSSVLRDNASTHVVIVTDDDNNTSLTDFDTAFQALNPNFDDYFHHSVVCHSNCPSAASIGTDYINLSMQTMGVAADLCDQDFDSVFDALTTAIIGGTSLACEFAIPAPPMGETLDPDLVNVEVDDGMGGVVELSRVDGADQCGLVADGWYYDDPLDPQMIILCPQTCEDVQSQKDGSISIAFGCETILPG